MKEFYYQSSMFNILKIRLVEPANWDKRKKKMFNAIISKISYELKDMSFHI